MYLHGNWTDSTSDKILVTFGYTVPNKNNLDVKREMTHVSSSVNSRTGAPRVPRWRREKERPSHPDVRPQRTGPLLQFTGSSLIGSEAQDVEIELLHGCLARCPYVDVLEVEEAS